MTNTILDRMRLAGMEIDAGCGGKGSCGRCRVRFFSTPPEPVEAERKLLDENSLKSGVRLACMHEYHDGDRISAAENRMEILDESGIEMPQKRKRKTGLICDIGTTTVVMKWIDCFEAEELRTVSFLNPQRAYGADVITRISSFSKHGNLLHDVLVRRMEQEILDAGIVFDEMIVAGNTVMTHLFLGLDVTPLGFYPFHVPQKEMCFAEGQTVLTRVPFPFRLITFPHISAYAGGDLTAGIYTLDIDRSEEGKMLVDLGTNGEIAAGSRNRITVTSCAAGPAFEGEGIRCGSGSVEGAVSQVSLEPLLLKTIKGAPPASLCGSGMISLLSELLTHQYMDQTGRLKCGNSFPLTETISLFQSDISSLQLAKAAVETGIRAVLERQNVSEIIISGGFGKALQTEDLKTLGMIPGHFENVRSAANTSLAGCLKLLMHEEYDRVKTIAASAEVIELAQLSDFSDRLVEALWFTKK